MEVLDRHMSAIFLSTPSARRATQQQIAEKLEKSHFYPRPPRGGRRKACAEVSKYAAISIHALREEGDRSTISTRCFDSNFYPRPPRGGRPAALFCCAKHLYISIHALREEGD